MNRKKENQMIVKIITEFLQKNGFKQDSQANSWCGTCAEEGRKWWQKDGVWFKFQV